MTVIWQSNQIKKENLNGFGPYKSVLDLKELIKLVTKSQKPKD